MKKLFIIIVIVFATSSCYSQIKDTINDFTEYQVSNESMKHVLDSVINVASNCAYFNQLNKNFYIIADFDSMRFSFRIYPHNVTTICLYKYNWRRFIVREGMCCYKNCYIYLLEHQSNSVLDDFFKPTGSSINIFLDKSDNIAEQSDPFLYFFKMDFSIENNKITSKERDEDDQDHDWKNRHYFEYLVQSGDTWRIIASKCGCSEDNLKKEYYEYERPIPGLLIVVKYIFDDDDLFQGVIRAE